MYQALKYTSDLRRLEWFAMCDGLIWLIRLRKWSRKVWLTASEHDKRKQNLQRPLLLPKSLTIFASCIPPLLYLIRRINPIVHQSLGPTLSRGLAGINVKVCNMLCFR